MNSMYSCFLRDRANDEAALALCIPGPPVSPDPLRALASQVSCPPAETWCRRFLPLCQFSPMCCRKMGLGPSYVSLQSLQRQPHAISLMLQAFKLPFYLNLCPETQAEKGPFQSQFLLYGFMGIVASSCRKYLLLPHGRGARGHTIGFFKMGFASWPARNSCLVPQCQAEP